MGWLSTVAKDLWKDVKAVGRAFIDVAAPVVARTVETIRRGVDAIRDAMKEEFRDPPKTQRERIERDLEQVNADIMRLRARYRTKGGLTAAEKRQNEALLDRRQELTRELEALDQVVNGETVIDEEDDYKPVHINDRLAHILQYHVGQGTFNKRCAKCGREMILQWKRSLAVASTRDFFWGCTGYYDRTQTCNYKDWLSRGDLDLFVNANRSEFVLTPVELTEFVLQKDPDQVRTAFRDLKSQLDRRKQGVEGYRCPVHKERLVPREKRVPNSLLDQFFLGCPQYLSNEDGCNYLVKLKSPAQLSAVFRAAGYSGVVELVG